MTQLYSPFFFQSINIITYKDVDFLEQEIRRLLKCSSQRIPVCVTTESYARFRCSIIQSLLIPPSERLLVDCTVQLSQGLVARLHAMQGDGDVKVHLGWEYGIASANLEDARGSGGHSKEKSTVKRGKRDDTSNSIARKRRKKGLLGNDE